MSDKLIYLRIEEEIRNRIASGVYPPDVYKRQEVRCGPPMRRSATTAMSRWSM